MIVATCLFMREDLRNLNSVREMIADPAVYATALKKLIEAGGIYARMGHDLQKQAQSEKEFAGVRSTCNTSVSFLDSEMISKTVESSSFSLDCLLESGSTIHFILPVEQSEAQKNFLRLAVSSALRHIERYGVKKGGETLFLLDECASLGSLTALEEAFQLGRGKGIRLMTFWQSIEQQQAAFKKIPNLVSDNSDCQVFFGVNSLNTAKLISEMLGSWTMLGETFNYSDSGGSSVSPSNQGRSRSYSNNWSASCNYSEHARPLLNPNEVLQLNGNLLIAFVKGVPPILARRIKYYSDKMFKRSSLTFDIIALSIVVALILFALL